jgi:GH24 family phage-related lysozyme (muramidase)
MGSYLLSVVRRILREDTQAQRVSLDVYGSPYARYKLKNDDDAEDVEGEEGEGASGPPGEAIGSLKLSEAGVKKLLRAEGNVLHVYNDLQGSGPPHPTSWSDTVVKVGQYKGKKGTLTIGMGIAIGKDAGLQRRFNDYLNGNPAQPTLIDAVNREKIAQFERALNANLTGAKMTQSMYDALFAMAWNTGPGAGAVKQVAKLILKGDYVGAQKAIENGPVTSATTGQVLDGLVKRRKEEAALFGAEGLNPTGATA